MKWGYHLCSVLQSFREVVLVHFNRTSIRKIYETIIFLLALIQAHTNVADSTKYPCSTDSSLRNLQLKAFLLRENLQQHKHKSHVTNKFWLVHPRNKYKMTKLVCWGTVEQFPLSNFSEECPAEKLYILTYQIYSPFVYCCNKNLVCQMISKTQTMPTNMMI